MLCADILKFTDMRNIIFFLLIIALTSCSSNKNNKNALSNNQIQFADNNSVIVFEGTLPCADCD